MKINYLIAFYSVERTEHSAKPEVFRGIIDTLYPYGPRIELFARSRHDNWEVLGMTYPDSKHADSFALGVQYQNKISDMVRKLYGINLHIYPDKQRQISIGEDNEGYEIKLDANIKHSKRISIETAEKSRESRREFYPSGIFRKDNTNYYIQGFDDFAWIFYKDDIRRYYKQNNPEIINDNPPTIEKFYISLKDANDLCIHAFALTDNGMSWYWVCNQTDKALVNCLTCSFYDDGHCSSKFGKELRIYSQRKSTI